jgi:serine-type D-Ala-D-Ala carboxypeptidase/endopeptidase (penicillin-binding protein 4)
VRAKTGTIIGGTALSGYGTTAGGRSFVFSVVINGPGAEASAGAIDVLVAAVAREAG